MKTMKQDWTWLWKYGCKEIRLKADRIEFDFAKLRWDIEYKSWGVGFGLAFKPVEPQAISITNPEQLVKYRQQLQQQRSESQ